jgi:hypothetical protein
MVSIRQPEPNDEPELPPLIWLTPEESRRQFDELARELVGMSGDEFICRLDAGEFLDLPDDEDHRAYAELSVMTALGRQV